jgi:NAD+ kinase
VKKIGLVVKDDAKAIARADEFERWLRAKNIGVVRKESSLPDRKFLEKNGDMASPDLFCIFVLGGDGTFLSAVRWIGDREIPILGIKFGEIGFLAETTEDRLFDVAEAILDETFTTNQRMRLKVKVIRDGKELVCETVLNDVVINRGAFARLANIETFVDDHYLTTYRADGLIVSTPTGSTAYSLAAGGPVIHPAVPAIILTPICPFTLTNRTLIVPDSVCIKIKLKKKSSGIMLTLDGQAGLDIDDRVNIIISKSDHPVSMITLPNQDYFDILKAKLKWSGRQQ